MCIDKVVDRCFEGNDACVAESQAHRHGDDFSGDELLRSGLLRPASHRRREHQCRPASPMVSRRDQGHAGAVSPPPIHGVSFRSHVHTRSLVPPSRGSGLLLLPPRPDPHVLGPAPGRGTPVPPPGCLRRVGGRGWECLVIPTHHGGGWGRDPPWIDTNPREWNVGRGGAMPRGEKPRRMRWSGNRWRSKARARKIDLDIRRNACG